MPLWTKVLSPRTLTTRRASSGGSAWRKPRPTPMAAPMQTSVSMASKGGSTPSE